MLFLPAGLLDGNRATVCGKMPYFQSKGFTNSETSSGQECVQDLILTVCLFNDGAHSFCGEGWLFLILNDGQVYELIVPLAWEQLFPVVINGRGDDQFHQIDVGGHGLCR